MGVEDCQSRKGFQPLCLSKVVNRQTSRASKLVRRVQGLIQEVPAFVEGECGRGRCPQHT